MTKRNSKGQFAKDATEGAQDYRDALITEYHLSVSKITKSAVEMSDKLDQIQRDIDLLKSGYSFMQEIQQHKGRSEEQPWEPKEGDIAVVTGYCGTTGNSRFIGHIDAIEDLDSDWYMRSIGRWFLSSNLRPATPEEIAKYQAEKKAKKHDGKRKKLVRGCRVRTPGWRRDLLG